MISVRLFFFPLPQTISFSPLNKRNVNNMRIVCLFHICFIHFNIHVIFFLSMGETDKQPEYILNFQLRVLNKKYPFENKQKTRQKCLEYSLKYKSKSDGRSFIHSENVLTILLMFFSSRSFFFYFHLVFVFHYVFTRFNLFK